MNDWISHLFNPDPLMEEISWLKSCGFEIRNDKEYRWIVIDNIEVSGAGWTWYGQPTNHLSVKIDIPPDFPATVPGVGFLHPRYAIHIPDGITWRGRKLSDVHSCIHSGWVWFCFQQIQWNPSTDGLIKLVGLIELSIYKRRPNI